MDSCIAPSRTQALHQHPQVLACGYRRIQSPKTALTFPAWLVQLSPERSYWRSKKDFLLLFRATKGGKTKLQCPKSALNKLSEKAPWNRQAPQPKKDVDINDQKSCHQNNNYEPSMTKNIYLLDTYLRSVAALCDQEDLHVSKAWSHFIRPHDTDGLLSLLPLECSEGTTLVGAMPLITSPDDDHEPGQNLRELPHQEEAVSVGTQHEAAIRSCKLGQYFCSPATARQLVHLTLEFVRQQQEQQKHKTQGPVVFLEPSCGHGDIVRQLLQDLDGTSIVEHNFHVLGCDIDDSAIQRCRQQFPQSDHLEWICDDFLRTTPSDHHASGTLVVLGGPPYTSGAGSGSLVERDLPLAFFLHCANVWKAAFVAFILPVRYKACPMQLPGWNVETHALSESSTFFFRGQEGVVQPSIIQCCTRTGAS